MKFKAEISKLEKLFKEKRHFEVISLGIQFIDFFCDRINRKIPLEEIPQNELDEIESHTGIDVKEWKNLKEEISRSLNPSESWKYKLLGVFDEILDSKMLPYIQVTPKLITKVRSVHSFRNKIQHQYYCSTISKAELSKKSKECLDLCQLFKKFDKELLDDDST